MNPINTEAPLNNFSQCHAGIANRLDYLDSWTQKVEKVTVADIRSAFARKLQPQRMVTVVLGAKP